MDINPKFCAETIWSRDPRRSRPIQCSKKQGHGPDGKYCKIHAAKHDSSEGEEWFCCTGFSWTPEPVCVTKHTDSRVWIKSSIGNIRQEAKHSEFYSYWPTKEAALQFLRRKAETAIENARNVIAQMEEAIKKIEEQQ